MRHWIEFWDLFYVGYCASWCASKKVHTCVTCERVLESGTYGEVSTNKGSKNTIPRFFVLRRYFPRNYVIRWRFQRFLLMYYCTRYLFNIYVITAPFPFFVLGPTLKSDLSDVIWLDTTAFRCPTSSSVRNQISGTLRKSCRFHF